MGSYSDSGGISQRPAAVHDVDHLCDSDHLGGDRDELVVSDGPSTVLASSGDLGPDMPMNTTSSLGPSQGDNVMEMKSQDSKIDSAAAGKVK